MGKNLRILIGILKDKTSIIKSTLSTKRKTKIRITILRASTHKAASAPPSEDRVAAVLSLGQETRKTACWCIESIMDRLHGTQNASVALKCLFTLHTVVTRGSLALKDQLSYYPASGGRNFLNLSKFQDRSDSETWGLSSWVRWYASVVEQNLIVSRFLGHFLSSSSSARKRSDDKEKVLALSNEKLLAEIEVLVDFVEVICEFPNSLHLQKNDLVYEVVKLVGEDHRLVQHEISPRVAENGQRISSLSSGELAQLLDSLQRLQDCKEKLGLLFVNRTRNDAMWEMISNTKSSILETMKQTENMRLVVVKTGIFTGTTSELPRSGERIAEFGKFVRFDSCGGLLRWDQPLLAVSTVS